MLGSDRKTCWDPIAKHVSNPDVATPYFEKTRGARISVEMRVTSTWWVVMVVLGALGAWAERILTLTLTLTP